MTHLRLTHTARLAPSELTDIRALLQDAFGPTLSEYDYEHALGGMHATVHDGAELVAHGSVVMRRLLHDGRALRTGYVEAMAVRAERRRHGLGAAVMGALEEVITGAYELGALSSSAMAMDFYLARGWQRWTGSASVMAPEGLRRLPGEEDAIFLLPVSADLVADGDLACDWRDGDVW